MKKEKAEAFDPFDEALSDVPNYEFIYEALVQSLSDQINEFMKHNNMNRVDLAQKLGTSKAYVTKVLSANANVSLRTIAKFTDALGAQFNFRLDKSDREIKWFCLIPGEKRIKRPQTERIEKFRSNKFENEELGYAAIES